jgi:hypothetical protein
VLGVARGWTGWSWARDARVGGGDMDCIWPRDIPFMDTLFGYESYNMTSGEPKANSPSLKAQSSLQITCDALRGMSQISVISEFVE